MFALTKSEFDIFAKTPVQAAVLGNVTTLCKSITPVEQNVLEFVSPADNEHYTDLNVQLMVRGKFVKGDGTDLAEGNKVTGVNNLLHSLFSHLSVSLNGTSVTPSEDLYNYRAYFETLFAYGQDASKTHLTNNFWYVDTPVTGLADDKDVLKLNGTLGPDASNLGWKERFQRSKKSKEIVLIGKLHGDLFNVSKLLLPGVKMQIRLTKSKREFYLMSEKDDSKAIFKFLDAALYVRKVKACPTIMLAHVKTLEKGHNAHYPITRVELKTYTFSGGANSISIDNAYIGVLPKRLLFSMVKNSAFSGTVDSNPYDLHHFTLNSFTMYVNGQQIPSEGLNISTDHQKTTTLAYDTLFKGSGIHHSNGGMQITHDMYINGFFTLMYDLTPDVSASHGHRSLPSNGTIRIEAKYDKPLPHAITCLLYAEYDNSIEINKDRHIVTDY